jgi:hypothetical protein
MKAKIVTADGTVIRVKGSKEEVLDVLSNFTPQYSYPWWMQAPYVYPAPLYPTDGQFTWTAPTVTITSGSYDPNINEVT